MVSLRPVVRSIALTGSIASIAAGCAGASTSPAASAIVVPSVAASPSIAASPSLAPSPTTAPSASASSAAVPLCAKEFTACSLEAGTYSATPFEPAFDFTIAGPWQNDRAWPEGGEIATADGAIQWASGVTTGFKEGLGNAGTAIGPKPADFIDYLQSFKGFTVTDPVPVTIDGVEGQQIDVSTNETGVHGIFVIPHDAFNVDAGEKIRFYVLDKDGQTVILTMDAFKEAGFDAFADAAQPVIDSVKWES